MTGATVERVILLVIDGLGVGAMPDAAAFRAGDAHAFTLRSIIAANHGLVLPELTALGLGACAAGAGLPTPAAPLAAHGRMALAHWGADTFAGHNELLGARPLPPETALFATVAAAVTAALQDAGHQVRQAIPGGSALLVDGAVVVGDNIEADAGLIHNVTGALAATPFAAIVAIGECVRRVVRTSRVIALGGTGISPADIVAHTRTTASGQTGVDSPALRIYNDGYRVRHLGYGIEPTRQAPSLLRAAGLPVTLIGKMADVCECASADYRPCVQTAAVFDCLQATLAAQSTGLIAATVQETDLAAHEQDPAKQAAVLALTDRGIGALRACLGPTDLLIVTADHGNDALIGHPFHTREAVPLLVWGQSLAPTDLGRRTTLADVAATICDCFGIAPPEAGTSFAPELGLAPRAKTPEV